MRLVHYFLAAVSFSANGPDQVQSEAGPVVGVYFDGTPSVPPPTGPIPKRMPLDAACLNRQ